MAYLTKGDILQATDVDVEPVEVPEWSGSVLVRGLDAQYVTDLMSSGFIDATTGTADIGKLDLKELAQRSMVDENGALLFKRNEVNELGKKSFSAIMRVATKALELSGFASEDDASEDDTEKEAIEKKAE